MSDLKNAVTPLDDWEAPKPRPYIPPCKKLQKKLFNADAEDEFCTVAGDPKNRTVRIWRNCRPEPVVIGERVSKYLLIYLIYIGIDYVQIRVDLI